MASTLTDVVRRRLLVAGYDLQEFAVVVGWAEFPHRATTAGPDACRPPGARGLRSRGPAPAGQGGRTPRPPAGPA